MFTPRQAAAFSASACLYCNNIIWLLVIIGAKPQLHCRSLQICLPVQICHPLCPKKQCSLIHLTGVTMLTCLLLHVLGMEFKTTLMACGIVLRDVGCRYHLHPQTHSTVLQTPACFAVWNAAVIAPLGATLGSREVMMRPLKKSLSKPTNQIPKTYLTLRCQRELPALRGS